jgi:hypothetical protein
MLYFQWDLESSSTINFITVPHREVAVPSTLKGNTLG